MSHRIQLGLTGPPPWLEVFLRSSSGPETAPSYVSLCSRAAPIGTLLDKLRPHLGLGPDAGITVNLASEGRQLNPSLSLADNGLPESGRCDIEFTAEPPKEQGPPEEGAGPITDIAVVYNLVEAWEKQPPEFLPAEGDDRGAMAIAHFLTDAESVPREKVGPFVRAGYCSAQGPRERNEDAEVIEVAYRGSPALSGEPAVAAAMFAVCDGHGGPQVARWTEEKLAEELSKQLGPGGIAALPRHERGSACQRAFIEVDAWLRRRHFVEGLERGCTCVTVIVWPEGSKFNVIFASLGDSRAILCSEATGLVSATVDHKPDDELETQRIVKAGGFVKPASMYGPARIDEDLAVARAFGDFKFKSDPDLTPETQKVSCVPDIYELEAAPGDTLVLACDGVFDVFTNAQAAAIALSKTTKGPGEAAVAVVRAALQQGSQDNVSCIVARLLGPGDRGVDHDDEYGEAW